MISSIIFYWDIVLGKYLYFTGSKLNIITDEKNGLMLTTEMVNHQILVI